MDLTKEENVKNLMLSSMSEAEWNSNCDKVKTANGGYPPFWYNGIVLSGVMGEAQSNWS